MGTIVGKNIYIYIYMIRYRKRRIVMN
jgi:hypothetical protein